jgi:hypothetical protein
MIAREDYWNTICPATIVNTTINFIIFAYDLAMTNLTLYYDCPASSIPNQPDTTQFVCKINYYYNNTNLNSIGNSLGMCTYNVKVLVLQSVAQTGGSLTEVALVQAIDGDFMLGWDANNSLCDRCLGTGG